MRLRIVLWVLCGIQSTGLFAQSCGCDHTINKPGIYRPATQGSGQFFLNVQPGQTICVQAGNYQYLRFKDMNGSASAPITVKNCGGQVKIGHNSYYAAMGFENCHYFHVTGTGSDAHDYGFRIDSSGTSSALTVSFLSSDFEIDHVEIAKAGFAGMMVKTDPACDNPATWRANFAMHNINIHHNRVIMSRGEGFYVGHSYWSGWPRTCNGQQTTLYPHEIHGLQIHHNIIEDAFADCLQYACAPDADVHHNVMNRCGIDPFDSYQTNGIQVGGGVGGDCHHNIIRRTSGMGIIVLGHLGNNRFYNNLISNTKGDGIFVNDFEGSLPNTHFYIANNTIFNAGRDAIRLYNQNNANFIVNNALVRTKSGNYIVFQQGATATQSNNFLTQNISSARFEDLVECRPRHNSPLVNTGTDASAFGVTDCLDDLARPSGGAYDIGAHEHQADGSRNESGDRQALYLATSGTEAPAQAWQSGNVLVLQTFEGAGAGQCTLYDLNGRPLHRFDMPDSADASLVTTQLPELVTGVYMLHIQTATGQESLKLTLSKE